MKEKTLEEYPEIMTASHIASYLHISRRRVYELLKLSPANGGIPCIEIGISKRVLREDLMKWIEMQKVS
ncbi:helix-turn-helix domain-containing protein [Bacillus sp. 1P02SD]|uniref:helix-turn-helix domain-containing protein n=1 Tax=Bacillus sp. 1P02SD TaxID=3132264 RepID=UPI0039A1C6AE